MAKSDKKQKQAAITETTEVVAQTEQNTAPQTAEVSPFPPAAYPFPTRKKMKAAQKAMHGDNVALIMDALCQNAFLLHIGALNEDGNIIASAGTHQFVRVCHTSKNLTDYYISESRNEQVQQAVETSFATVTSEVAQLIAVITDEFIGSCTRVYAHPDNPFAEDFLLNHVVRHNPPKSLTGSVSCAVMEVVDFTQVPVMSVFFFDETALWLKTGNTSAIAVEASVDVETSGPTHHEYRAENSASVHVLAVAPVTGGEGGAVDNVVKERFKKRTRVLVLK